MAHDKVIAVVGATGAQGGGLVRAILDDRVRDFAARAITRDAKSDKARALGRMGAQLVEADVDSVESLTRAFHGAHAAYCVTFFWDHFSPDREKAQARNMAEAAKAAGVKHVIWSTLEDSRKYIPLSDDRMPTLMDKYKVPHFDAKAEADHYFSDAGVPTTFLLTSFYWDNLIYFGMGPKKGPDGRLVFTLPMGDKKLPGIAAEDIGRCAYGIFKRGAEFIGKRVGIAGEHLTGAADGHRAEPGARADGALQRRVAGCVPGFRISRRRGSRQHVPVQPRFLGHLLRGAGPGLRTLGQSRTDDFRPVAGEVQGPHPAGVALQS